MKDDLISRQAAIDAIEREKSLDERPIQETRWFDLGLGKAQDVLSGLPPAQPEKVFVAEVKVSGEDLQQCVNRAVERLKEEEWTDGWIPCSERLPKEFESVLVCYKSQGGTAQAVSERITNADGSTLWSALAGIEPIAWMPLPEPYEAESEDEE